LTERLAIELGRRGIRANVVSPVLVATKLGLQALEHEGERVERIVNGIPMQRLCQPSDVADAVAFLASEHAGFITGIELRVDGGSGAAGLIEHRNSDGSWVVSGAWSAVRGRSVMVLRPSWRTSDSMTVPSKNPGATEV
jgi:hypothetical protein